MRVQSTGQDGQQPGLVATVVHVADHGPLDRGPAAGSGPPLLDGLLELGQRPQLVHRDQLVAKLVRGGVQAHGEPDLGVVGGEAADAGNQTHGGDGDMAGAEVHAVGVEQPGDRVAGGPVVRHRLAHAHEHHVGQAPGRGLGESLGGALRPEHLGGDLAGGQVGEQPHLSRGAEAAVHRAAHLGRHAHRDPVPVPHDHGLDDVGPSQPEEGLSGAAAVGLPLEQHLDLEGKLLGQPLAERLGEVRHAVVADGPAPEAFVDLAGSEGRLAPLGEAGREGGQVEVVDGHPPRVAEVPPRPRSVVDRLVDSGPEVEPHRQPSGRPRAPAA